MFEQKNLNKLIMVVKRSDLFEKEIFYGFLDSDTTDFKSVILEKYGWMTRGFAEEDSNYKQPIVYCSIVNPKLKKIYAFQRAKKDKNYTEKKLQEKWSLGLGGHVEQIDDLIIGAVGGDPLNSSMIRELREEGGLSKSKIEKSQIQGYINIEDEKLVNLAHFGMLYVIETDLEKLNGKDKEISKGKFYKINELEKMLNSKKYDFEDWSRVSFNTVKDYVKNL